MKILLSAALALFVFSICNSQVPERKAWHVANTKIVAGCHFLAVGAASVGVGIWYDHYRFVDSKSSPVEKSVVGVGYGMGAAFLVSGGILLGLGCHDKQLYEDRKSAVTIIYSDRIGLAYRF